MSHVGHAHPDRAVEFGRGHGVTVEQWAHSPEARGIMQTMRAPNTDEARARWSELAERAQAVVDGMGTLDRYLNRDLERSPEGWRLSVGQWSPDEPDVIQSPERPSNEIVLCWACNHPDHRAGDGRCCFLVPPRADGADGHEGMDAVCECGWADSVPDVQFDPDAVTSPGLIALCGLCGHPDHSAHPERECGHEAGIMGVPCSCLYLEIDPPVDGYATVGGVPDEDDQSHVIREGDPAYNDLQTYLEGGTLESTDAAKLLDQRGVDYGQVSPKTFWDAWGELPRSTYQSHKIWCARPGEHPHQDCPVWGAE
jgi:hypothetical protein